MTIKTMPPQASDVRTRLIAVYSGRFGFTGYVWGQVKALKQSLQYARLCNYRPLCIGVDTFVGNLPRKETEPLDPRAGIEANQPMEKFSECIAH